MRILASDTSHFMNKAFTLSFFSTFMFYGIFGQYSGEIEKVIYDPLLWKAEMNLTKSQCEEISRINISFYELLYSADNLDSASRLRIDELYFLIHARSEQIWKVFSDRQKRKWAKLHLSSNNDRNIKRLLSRFLKKPPKPLLAFELTNIGTNYMHPIKVLCHNYIRFLLTQKLPDRSGGSPVYFSKSNILGCVEPGGIAAEIFYRMKKRVSF